MIEIGGYRLNRIDKLNWTIQEKMIVQGGDNKGNDYWKTLAYYPRLEQAALRLFDVMVSRAEVASVDGLITEVHRARNEIIEAVTRREKKPKPLA